MALKKCKECGHDVSSKAESCPSCGAKQKESSTFGCLSVVALAIVLFAVIGSFSDTSPPEPTNAVTPTPAPAKPIWTSSSGTDEMTGELRGFAFSPSVGPTRSMAFPYGDTRSHLAVGCNSSSQWSYFHFSESPNLTGGSNHDGYEVFKARIRWDSTVTDVELIQEWGANTLHFRDESSAIASIKAGRSVRLELDWYGQGKVYFEYSLDGSSAAIDNALARCR